MAGMLDKDELKRRIDAFRTLRGLTQVDLADLFAAKGHGSQELGRLERGALPLTEIRRRSLAEILEVPEQWFEDERLVFTSHGSGGSGLGSRIDRLVRAMEQRVRHDEKIDEMLERQTDILTRIEQLIAQTPQPGEAGQALREGLPAARRLAERAERSAEDPPSRDVQG
jgi:transcriptional regulator with XRE-family HTH domain